MAEHHGAEHHVLGQLLGLGFDHQHAFLRAGDDEVEIRLRHLLDLRVELVLAVDIADARGSDRPHERDAGNGERRRRADQGDDVGVVLHVMRQHRADDLRLVAESVGEERADRAVDEAGDQRLLLARPALALEEAAGDLARRERLLLVVDGQREKIDPHARRLVGHRRAQHDRVAIRRQYGAVGLARDAPGLEHELAPAPHHFLTGNLEHVLPSFRTSPRVPDGRAALAAWAARMAVLQRAYTVPRTRAAAARACAMQGALHRLASDKQSIGCLERPAVRIALPLSG